MAWPVEALKELIDAIQSGTRLEIPSHVRDGFTNRYQGAFRSQSESSWPPIKSKVLNLGKLVGSVAEVLTRAKALDLGGPIPESVDADCAFHAGQMVREEMCPPLGPRPGVWCEGYPAHSVGGSDDLKATIESIRAMLRRQRPAEEEVEEDVDVQRPWTVEGALTEVILAIESGSRLPVGYATKEELKSKYRGDFKREYDLGRLNWNDYRDRVLVLARLVGSLASSLTFLRAAIRDDGAVPVEVEPRMAYLAGFLVSKNICPPGVWCEQYSLDPDPEADIISTAFKLIVQLLRGY